MSYSLDIDPLAEQQIAALPQVALPDLAEALTILQLVPWNGLPVHENNPGGAVRHLPFGRMGMITYLILDEQQRVDILIITWTG